MSLRITADVFRKLHPMKVVSTTDFYYAGIANKVFSTISKMPEGRELEQDTRIDISLNIAQYFEDIVGDIGVWASFTAKHHELYCKPLPFYDVNVDDYYPDELHLEDIKYLLWDTLMSINYETIYNPETPSIEKLSSAICSLLEKEWEKAPINEDLKLYLQKAPFQHDFYEMRNMLQYFFFHCYLTASRYHEEYLEESMDYIKHFYRDDIDGHQLFYAAESRALFKYRIGPLALYSYQWLAMLMRENENDLIAERFEVIEWRDLAPYKVKRYDKAFVYLLDYRGRQCAVPLDSFMDNIERTLEHCNIFIGSIVKYDGNWQVNGMSSWGNQTEFYKDYKALKDREEKYSARDFYYKVIDRNNGRRLFFFKDLDDYVNWIRKELKMKSFSKEEFGYRLPHENFPAMLIDPENSDLCLAMGAARVIKHPDNPYYDQQKAKEEAIMIFNPDAISDVMARYVVENDLVPDAALNSLYGEEHGRKLVQDNLDFLARTLRRHDY